jgi:hypothetical protein
MNICHTNLNSFKLDLKLFSSNTNLILTLKPTTTTAEDIAMLPFSTVVPN